MQTAEQRAGYEELAGYLQSASPAAPSTEHCYMFLYKPAGQCLSYREKEHG